MEPGFVQEHLLEWQRRRVYIGILLASAGLLFGILPGATIWVRLYRDGVLWGVLPVTFHDVILVVLLSMVSGAGLYGAVLVICASAEMGTWPDRNPDIVALSRLGNIRKVVAAINAEMANSKQVVRVGHRYRTFQISWSSEGANSYTSEAYLTPNWLVCLTGYEGHRFTIFRLRDIVLVVRVPPPISVLFAPLSRHVWVALVDRHGVRLELPFREADATRLLAEVLARVPWAINRFVPAREHASAAGLDNFITEADQRREQQRFNVQTPPISPS
jgi:hypothetical protein